MLIDLTPQILKSPRVPMTPFTVFAGSALPLAFVGIPDKRPDGSVVSLSVVIVNADGASFTAPCAKTGAVWSTAFPASCFEHYGTVLLGAAVVAQLVDGASSLTTTIAMGDLDVLKSSPECQPGTAHGEIIEVEDFAHLPETGIPGVLYVTLADNQIYRFNVATSAYVEISTSAVDSVNGEIGAVVLTASDISDLGNAATKNVGTAAGTVAAGDHTHSEYATKSALDEGWWSEWTILRTLLGVTTDVTSQVGQPQYNSDEDFWDVSAATLWTDGEHESPHAPPDAVSLSWSCETDAIYTATRHRVAAPVPTRPSDIGAAPLASPAFTGTPTAPTPTRGDDSTKVATTAFVQVAMRYSFNTATVATGTTPTVTNVLDRAINNATLGSTVTAATVTLPAATTGRSRDFFLDLTIEATDAPTLSFIDPARGTSAAVKYGADSLADIAPGNNLVLFTEIAPTNFLVSVKHEDAQ